MIKQIEHKTAAELSSVKDDLFVQDEEVPASSARNSRIFLANICQTFVKYIAPYIAL